MAKILHILKENSRLDLSGYGYDATSFSHTASKGFISTEFGYGALDFDGITARMPIKLTSPAVFQNGFTISAWIKARSYGSTAGSGNSGRIIDKSEDSESAALGFMWVVSDLSAGKRLGFTINNAGTISTPVNSIEFNTWYHILVTVAANGATNQYINAILQSGSGTTGAVSTITTNRAVSIGNRSLAVNRSFDGLIKNVKIFNTVLTLPEINKDFSEFQLSRQAGQLAKGIRNYSYPNFSIAS